MTKLELRKHEIIEAIKGGQRMNFGSDRETDHALQGLRKAGRIRYRKVNAGGQGWELVPESERAAAKNG